MAPATAMKATTLTATNVCKSVAETVCLKPKEVKGAVEAVMGVACGELTKHGLFKLAGMLTLKLKNPATRMVLTILWKTVVCTHFHPGRQLSARAVSVLSDLDGEPPFFQHCLVSHPCGCASLGQERRRPLEEAKCHVRLQSLFRSFACQSGAQLPESCREHCRRFEVDNFNESPLGLPIFFLASDCCFPLLLRPLSPVLRHRHITSYRFFFLWS